MVLLKCHTDASWYTAGVCECSLTKANVHMMESNTAEITNKHAVTQPTAIGAEHLHHAI